MVLATVRMIQPECVCKCEYKKCVYRCFMNLGTGNGTPLVSRGNDHFHAHNSHTQLDWKDPAPSN